MHRTVAQPSSKKSASAHGRGARKTLFRSASFLPFLKRTAVLLFLVALGAILFALAFPNPLLRAGFAPAAFIALLPAALLSARVSLKSAVPWGALYGYASYALFNYWLGSFNPLAFFVVPVIYGAYFALLFVLLRLAYVAFPRGWFLAQCFLWMGYEYLRIQGFLGYSFGLLGYSLAFHPLLIQAADIFGVWILSLFTAFPSFALAFVLINVRGWMKRPAPISTHPSGAKPFAGLDFIRKNRTFTASVLCYCAGTLALIWYGVAAQKPFEQAKDSLPSVRMALVQHNRDPWEGGPQEYGTSLQILARLTKEAMISDPPPEVVVWSETAFVPSIYFHSTYRQNPYYARLVDDLFDLFAEYPQTDFIIGNGERIGEREKQERGLAMDGPDEYNAAHLFQGRERKGVYYKNHLVPFTETFPKNLAWLYALLEKNGARFWLPGTTLPLLEGRRAKYATPICFEDGFGLQNAEFVRGGAQIIVNVTNDAWSGVETNAMQHLQLSVLRAVENRRAVVRSTNGGMTAFINPNGAITSMLPSFTEGTITEDVPIYDSVMTPYTRFGDWFGLLCLGLGAGAAIFAGILAGIRGAARSYVGRKRA